MVDATGSKTSSSLRRKILGATGVSQSVKIMPLIATTVLTGLTTANVALAQDAPLGHATAATTAPLAPNGMSEVVVTARRRVERLQEVPLSITAVSAATIEKAQVLDLSDVARLSPALSFYSSGSGLGQTPIIRGVVSGNVLSDAGDVSVFLDGIYLSSRNALNLRVLDVDRIEVVEGPQGTLFGQNSYNGAINYVMKEPGKRYEGFGEVSAGQDGYLLARAAAGGPVIDDIFGLRLAVSTQHYDGGYTNTANPSKNLQGYDDPVTVSAVGVFTPIQQLRVKGKFFYGEDNQDQDAGSILPANCGNNGSGAFTRFCGTVPTQSSASINPKAYGNHAIETIAGIDVDYTPIKNLTISSRSDYEFTKNNSLLDAAYDAAGEPLAAKTASGQATIVNAPIYFSQGNTADLDYSEELRVAYTTRRFNFLLGGYYYTSHENVGYTFSVDDSVLPAGDTFTSIYGRLFGTPNPFTNPVPSTVAAQRTDDVAFFGQFQYNITDKIRFDAEARHTIEDVRLHGIVSGTVPVNTIKTAGFSFWTPRVSLDYRPTREMMFYASAAKGERAGGISTTSSPNIPSEGSYLPETNMTYEVGARTQWLRNRVTANLTLFYSDLTNLQEPQRSADPTYLFNITGNSGSAVAKGVELETSAAITRDFTVGVNYSHTDPTFDKGQLAFGISGCGVGTAACGALANAQGGIPIGGNQLPNSRRDLLSVNATYERPIVRDWSGYVRADLRYQSGFFAENINTISASGFTTVNLRIGAETHGVDIAFFARNLFDKVYVNYIDNTTRVSGLELPDLVEGERRILGVDATARF